MLRLLKSVDVRPPVHTFSPSYETLHTVPSSYQFDPQDFQSLISKVKLTIAVKGHEFIDWMTKAKCRSISARNATTKMRAAVRKNVPDGLDVHTRISALNINSKTCQTFSGSYFLPCTAKFSSIFHYTSNFSERTMRPLHIQMLGIQTRGYSTRILNRKNVSKIKPSDWSWYCNVSSPLLRDNVRSKSSSTGGVLETAEDVAAYISQEASSILVMTGAGLSTASGIPDFRSPGTGIYDNLQNYDLPYPEAIFDIQFFMMDPRPFVTLAQELYPGLKFKPNAGHHFIRLLQDLDKLHRVYTQNIDGLERLSGIREDKLMEAHGSFASASCTLCGTAHDPEHVKQSIVSGPGVPSCGVRGCKGKVKPDIVFFGENLPNEFWRFEEDLHAVDLLLIIGTSLEVYPFASIAESARNVTPRVLINRTAAGSIGTRPKDCLLRGDIVETVMELARLCGWERELDELARHV
ncbi:Sirtuin family [Trinorchestia longiramus]|nr:Sirtuin family [Trinorchestia longiramus]